MTIVHANPGEHIASFIARVTADARTTSTDRIAVFNDLAINLTPRTSVKDGCVEYERLSAVRFKAWNLNVAMVQR